jgi:uncharacterized protein YjbI with pentapeptide repeats
VDLAVRDDLGQTLRMPRHPDDEQLRVLPWWLVIAGLAAAASGGGLILLWLLDVADSGGEQAALRIEAIRTSLAVVAGTGGGLALVFAARRQWINERAQRHGETVTAQDHAHRERVQAHREAVAAAEAEHRRQQAVAAEQDATERRVTDLYANAVNLLASDRAAIRTAGLYALERLARDHEAHRQTIAEVICAYLRLPEEGGDATEAQVRATAQRLLARHLRPDDPERYWPGIQLDLVGAVLADVDLRGCEVAAADFSRATFTGATRFTDVVVDGELRFAGARMEAADFDRVHVRGRTSFDNCVSTGDLSFAGARFDRRASFREAEFQGDVLFLRAGFGSSARLDRARFHRDVVFHQASVTGPFAMEHAVVAGAANFNRAHFADLVLLRFTAFEAAVLFENARLDGTLNLARVRFGSSAQFAGAVLHRKPLLDQTLASATAIHDWPPGCVTEPRDQEWLLIHGA